MAKVAKVDFEVSDQAPFGLCLRARPDSSTPSTKKALLPMGHQVEKLRDSEDPDWWEVSTLVEGERLMGFVKSSFLAPVQALESSAAYRGCGLAPSRGKVR